MHDLSANQHGALLEDRENCISSANAFDLLLDFKFFATIEVPQMFVSEACYAHLSERRQRLRELLEGPRSVHCLRFQGA